MIKAITRQIFLVAGLFAAGAAGFWVWFWLRYRQAAQAAAANDATGSIYLLLLAGGWLLLAAALLFIYRRLRQRDRAEQDQS